MGLCTKSPWHLHLRAFWPLTPKCAQDSGRRNKPTSVLATWLLLGRIQDLISGGAPDHDMPKLLTVHSSIVRVKRVLFSVGSGAHLRALEALGYFITKYAFSPFWVTFLYYFWNNKILIFLDKLPWQTFLYTGIQILDQMDMYLFLKNYFLLKYQSIMHKNHNAMFMINVHFIMYKLYEPMKIKWSDAWIHICIRQWERSGPGKNWGN